MQKATRQIRFAICLGARSEEDLQVGKVYRVLPDVKASEVGCLRILDDSGEDYLYAANRFAIVDLPEKDRARFLKAIRSEPGMLSGKT
jgi:hypothetical protein